MSDIKDNHKIDILKKEFPECFDRYGNFNLEKFQGIISPETKIFKDSYGLNWLGKSYARALAQGEPRKMLSEDVKHNSREENKDSENLYIKGDNLEVLKHLDNGYREKIKMIYIDPPYNTKSGEFVYNDNRDFSEKELDKLVRSNIIDEEEKERILKWEGKSSSHSAWLTFIFPRLYLSRKLLTEDGVIFISIDDNEISQLKLICDEIFGEENFIAQFIHKNNSNKNQAKLVSISTEYFYCYAKNNVALKNVVWRLKKKGAEDISKLFNQLRKNGLSLEEIETEIKEMYRRPKYAHLSRWNKVDNKGVFKDADLSREGGPKDYTIINPNTEKECIIPNRGWGKSKEELLRLQQEDLIWYGSDNTPPGLKDYINPDDVSVPDSFWYFDNSVDTRWIKNAFGKLVFENPKPLEMIKSMIEMVRLNNSDLILDFFSGSATTAHAVNRLNLEDNGNRKWIMVQLEEELSKNSEAYKFCEKERMPKNITSIGIERIKRANSQMLDEEETKNQENFDRIELEKKLGFKIFGINNKIKELDEMIEFTDEITLPEPVSFTNNDRLALVHTYKLQDGNFLNAEIEKVKLSWEKTVIGGDGSGTYIYEGYRVGEILYLIDSICSSEVQSKIIEKIDNEPEFKINKIVIYGFTNTIGKYRVELEENIKNYNNKKGANIEIEVRY